MLSRLGDDRQTQPGTAAVAAARVISTLESVEDALPVLLGHPFSVVIDTQCHPALGGTEGKLDPGTRMAPCVLGSVADGSHKKALVGEHASRADPGGVHGYAECAQPVRLGEHDVVEIDLSAIAGDALVQPGQEQQVVDEAVEPAASESTLLASDSRSVAPG